MHGFVVLDAHDWLLCFVIFWNDARVDEQCWDIEAKLGFEGFVVLIGNCALVGCTVSSLLWVCDYELEIYVCIVLILLLKDYICLCLMGGCATDVVDVFGMLLFDVVKCAWLGDVLEALEFDDGWLLLVHESPASTGRLGGCVLVAVGAGDEVVAVVGNGVVR